ncbi:MAG: diversity-generating retroelement protein Avd, partial [Phycisphaerales bacterium]|nr:diversity-generating retroelement protein Avd [Phycisphaerales bacterium]
MTRVPRDRAPAREAPPELLVQQKWEAFCAWLLPHADHWPKAARFTLAQRVQNHALDILELVIVARYEPGRRRDALAQVNRRLERMRHLFRIARATDAMPLAGFETAMRGVDEVGRMAHGWREAGRA